MTKIQFTFQAEVKEKRGKEFCSRESNIFLFGVKCESVCKIKDWIGIKQGDCGSTQNDSELLSTPWALFSANVHCFIETETFLALYGKTKTISRF